MPATANKVGYGSTSGHVNHGDYRVTHSGSIQNRRGYKTASPTVRSPKQDESSLPESCPLRSGYLRAAKTVRSGDRVVFAPTMGRPTSEGRMEALPLAERPKPQTVSLPAATISVTVSKAFAMHMEHLDFLRRVSTGDSPPIAQETAVLAAHAWQLIWKASEYSMPVPSACTGPDGKMFYSWDKGRHHLEMEIIPGRDAEFFYRDRDTGYLWGDDYRIGDTLTAETVAKLRFFQ